MTTLALTYVFTSGTTIQSSQVNGNYSAIVAWANGGIDNTNIAASAAIAFSKLDATGELFVKRATTNPCLSTGITGDTNPRCTVTADGGIKFGAGTTGALDLLFKREDANTLAVRNAGDSAYKNLKADVLTLNTKLAAGSGGTGIALPTANQILGVDAGATAYEGKTLTAGTGIGITYPSAGVVTITNSSPGSFGSVSPKTASFNAATGYFYLVDSTSSPVVCTLPTAVGAGGQEIAVVLSTAVNALSFNTTSGQTISGQASGAISTSVRYNIYRFLSDGANWHVQ